MLWELNWKLYLTALANILLLGLQEGYHLTVLNAPEAILENFLRNSTRRHFFRISDASSYFYWSAIVSCYSLAFAAGALMAGRLSMSGEHGFKVIAVGIGNALGIVGNLFMVFAHAAFSIELLFIGRVIVGIANGLALTLLPIFINDTAPARLHGPLNSVIHIAIWIGGSASVPVSSDYGFGTRQLWPWIFIIPLIACVAHLATFPLFPESPKHLAGRENFDPGHLSDLIDSQSFYGKSAQFNEEGSSNSATSKPRKLGTVDYSQDARRKTLIRENRFRLFMGVFASLTPGSSGYMAVAAYYTTFIEDVLDLEEETSQIVAFVFLVIAVLMSVVAIYTVESWGRRPMFVWSSLGFVLCHMLFFMTIQYFPVGSRGAFVMFAVANGVLVVAYNLGPGPASNFIGCEIVPNELAEYSQSLSFVAMFIGMSFFYSVFNPLRVLIGSYVFLLLALINLINFIVFYCWMPETRPDHSGKKTGGKKPSLGGSKNPFDNPYKSLLLPDHRQRAGLSSSSDEGDEVELDADNDSEDNLFLK